MEIRILHQSREAAAYARGFAVVIDVFRAFSVACYLADRGAARIIPVRTAEEAFALKAAAPDSTVIIGENGGDKITGFDHGNSPTELAELDLTGKIAILRTSAGTQNLCAVPAEVETVTGSFVNAGAILAHIHQRQPKIVSLVCSGLNDESEATEDTLCAEYLQDSLEGCQPDFQEVHARICAAETSRRFFDPTITSAPEEDLHRCLQLSRFNFVLQRVNSSNEGWELRTLYSPTLKG